MNKVLIIGNLGNDPDLRFTPSGSPVCNFSVATNRKWTSKSGEEVEHTEWHRIVVWGKQGELCKEYLAKGRRVFIEGRIESRSWNDKETNEKRYMTEIIAENVQFLDRPSKTKEQEEPKDRVPADETP